MPIEHLKNCNTRNLLGFKMIDGYLDMSFGAGLRGGFALRTKL